MDTKTFKKLIKEAVREVLHEELLNLGKTKLQESLNPGENWPSVSFTSKDINPGLRQSLAEKMGLPLPGAENSVGGYADILAQTAAELRNNPAEISNFKNMGG